MVLKAEALSGSAGLVFVFTNILLEQAGLPIPAIPTLLVVGALTLAHPGWGATAIALATIACILADASWYYAGRLYGNRIIHLLCRVSLSPDSCVSQTHVRFERWGLRALLFAKFVPGLSTIAPPLAGALRLNFGGFLQMTTLGALIWTVAFVALGALAAPQINWLLPQLARLGGGAAVLIVAVVVLYVLVRWLQRRRLFARLRADRIGVHELKAMMGGEHPPLVVDVRSNSAWRLDPRSIPGALHVPPDEINRAASSVLRGQDVVLYCNCPNEASAVKAAQFLNKHGVVRVRPLLGGLDAWVEAGYPATTPESAGSAATPPGSAA